MPGAVGQGRGVPIPGPGAYEIGNMDHAVKMGIDAPRRLLTGTVEELWRP